MRCACACSAAPLRGGPDAATAAAGAVTAAAAAAPGGRWCRVPRRPDRREGAAGRDRGRRRRLRKAAGPLKKRGRADPPADERGGERGDPPRAPCVRCRPGSGAERRRSRAAAADGEPATPEKRSRSGSGRKRRGTAGPGRTRSGGAAGHVRGGGGGSGGEPGRRRGAESARGQVRLGRAGSERRRHCCAAGPRSEAAAAAAEAAPQQPRRAAAASEEEGSPPEVLVAAALLSSQYFLFGLSFASPRLPPSPHTPTLSHSSVEAALGPGSFPPPGDAACRLSRAAGEPRRDHEEIQHQEGAGRPDRGLVLGLAAAAAAAAPVWEPGAGDPGNAPVRALSALQDCSPWISLPTLSPGL